MEVKPAEFARRAGVSRQSIYSKIKNGTLQVNSAGFLDTENSQNAQYLADQGRRGKLAPAQPPPSPESSAPTPPPVIRTDIQAAADAGIPQELLGLTIRDLVMRYNGLYNLERHAKILRDLTMSSEKDQRIRERSLKTIDKDFVASRLFQYLDVLMRQLLEFPDSVADSIVSKVLSLGDSARGEIIGLLRTAVGRIISGSKDQVINELNTLRGRYQAGERIEEITQLPDTGSAAE